jgi:hypothetical protein
MWRLRKRTNDSPIHRSPVNLETIVTTNLIFVLTLLLLHIGLYTWGFRHLSEERWQFIGTIPLAKDRDGQWRGLNLVN